MYGLLLENLATFIKAQWGEGKWESVRRHAGVDLIAFSIHHVYPETLMRRIARSAFQVLGVDERQFFKAMGIYFVQYVSQYGYDQLLSVLGRHLRDFLNGLDNLHEYLKFSYPKMRAPSFYCDDETETGLKLHYRSKRRGFVYYVMGQIKQVAKQFYNQECNIHLLSEEVVGETIHVVFELTFDNSAFSEAEELRALIGKDLRLPVRASTLFELFPFCIVFNSEMEITHTGHTLMTILKDLVGQVMTEAFDMSRPLIPFCFSAIMQRRNNIFELITVAPIHDVNQFFGATDSVDEEKESEGTRLRLRGQMLYMEDWNMMLYLANPVMPDLNGLVDCSLYINDLSLHDCSRDLVLAGTQQSVELKLALDQEQQKSRKLVQSMQKLDEEMKRTDELLYQMIPKQVADRIRKGENPVETCQTFDSVSILFTDVVNFTDICSQITPLQVVSMLNHMYFLFDQLSERNGVYKVETVGDSYMVVSGAPIVSGNHADRICDMAMDIIDASEAIDDPSGRENGLRVRVGCHSGAVVAGVVGIKMPRYCLFGDAVNTASRMESTAEPGKIQISDSCKNLLTPLYSIELRGTINVKGKGEMYTYWLLGREARVPLSKYYSKTIIWTPPTAKLLDGIGGGRPMSPNSIYKHLDRTESLIVASPSSSGTTAFKNQKFAAPIVKDNRPLQCKLTRRPTNTFISVPSTLPVSLRHTTKHQPQFYQSSNRALSSPELQSMSKFGKRRSFEEFESDENIQVYFNKNLETKRREATSSLQEKHKHNKIIQPTSVYDSDLIKEAFNSPLGGKLKCENASNPVSPAANRHNVKHEAELSAEVIANAAMIIAGILPDYSLPRCKYKNKTMLPVSTGVGEGLLTEYILAVEKKLHGLNKEKKVDTNKKTPTVGGFMPETTNICSTNVQTDSISEVELKSDGDQDSVGDSVATACSIDDPLNVGYLKQPTKNAEDPITTKPLQKPYKNFKAISEKLKPSASAPNNATTTTEEDDMEVIFPMRQTLNMDLPYPYVKRNNFVRAGLFRKDSISMRDTNYDTWENNQTKTAYPGVNNGIDSAFTSSIIKDVCLSSLIETTLAGSKNTGDSKTCTESKSFMKETKGLASEGKSLSLNRATEGDDNELKPLDRVPPIKTAGSGSQKIIKKAKPKSHIAGIIEENDFQFQPIRTNPTTFADKLAAATRICDATKIANKKKTDDPLLSTTLSENKLAEVRVEKWIRKEFAAAKEDSIEDSVDSSNDEFSEEHFPQILYEKWNLTDDESEKWIRDDLPEVFNKVEDLGLEDFQASLLDEMPKISSENIKDKDNSTDSISQFEHGSPKSSTDVITCPQSTKLTSDVLADCDSNSELLTYCPKSKPHGTNGTTDASKTSIVKKIAKTETSPSACEAHKNEERKDCCGQSSHTYLKNDTDTCLALPVVDTPKSFKTSAEPNARLEKIDSNWVNKVIERSWEIVHSEGKPELHHVVIPCPKPHYIGQAIRKPKVKSLEELQSLNAPPISFPVTQEKKGTAEKFQAHANTLGPHTLPDKYAVFSSDFRTTIPPAFSPELVKTINKNCTKFFYDCLSIPSYVDNDYDTNSVDNEGQQGEVAVESEQTQHSRQSKKRTKETPVKHKLFKIFNRADS